MESDARKVLVNYWGYSSFRPLQEEIIDSVLAGNQNLALLPTGGGKSICFQVPALILKGTCVVITPLIALMKDQVSNLRKKNIKAAAVYTGMHRDEIEAIYSNAIYGDLKFLYISPERLSSEIARNVLSKMKVNILAIDEAHCISQWGYDFRPSYLKIAEIKSLIPDCSILALTATATPIVVEDIANKLGFKSPRIFKSSFERKNLSYNVQRESDKTSILMRELTKINGSAILYVRNRRKTREISEILSKNNISSTYYHAGLDGNTRDFRQKEWTMGRIKVMVATNAFGMGIDKSNVRTVIHYDLPDSIESYFQEAGRAGRDLQPATALMIYDYSDISRSKDLFKASYPDLKTIKNVYNALGNYFQVPEGSGKDMGFDFDIAAFANNYGFDVLVVYNSIKFLEKEGFITYIQSAGQYSKLHVPLNKEELYRFIVENPGSDKLLKEIMRSYSGIFTDYININETLLAKRSEMSRDSVVKKLIYFDNQKIVKYIPIKTKPQLVFAYERLSAKHIELSPENYRDQKAAAEKRLISLLDFTVNKIQCRSKILLEYFGEKKVRRCGICDVCKAENKLELNEIEFSNIENNIKKALANGPMHLYQLVAEVKQYDENDVIQVVRWLMENNRVVRNNDQSFEWYKQLNLGFQ